MYLFIIWLIGRWGHEVPIRACESRLLELFSTVASPLCFSSRLPNAPTYSAFALSATASCPDLATKETGSPVCLTNGLQFLASQYPGLHNSVSPVGLQRGILTPLIREFSERFRRSVA